MKITDDQIERLIVAFEDIAAKPPTVIAQTRQQDQLVKDEPQTVDGMRYRHALKSGGYLIEIMVGDNQVAFIHEDKDGNRNRFVFG